MLNEQVIYPPEGTYVAQLLVPTVIVNPSTSRVQIEHPQSLGVSRGYFYFEARPDNAIALPGSTMAILGVEGLATSLRAAEDQSHRAGERFSAAISGFLGTPYQEPLLEKLAKKDSERHLLAQHHYIHMLQPFVSSRASWILATAIGRVHQTCGLVR